MISSCMQYLHSPTPIFLCTTAPFGFCPFFEDFFLKKFKSSILFLLKGSPLYPPSPCMNFTGVCSHQEAKALSLLSFCNSDSFKAPRTHSLCSTSTFTTLNDAEDFEFSLPRLAVRSSVRPALTCTARIIQNNSGLYENESLTVEPPQRTLCGGIRLHSMQESPGSNRETIETYSRLSLTDFEFARKSYTQHIKQQHNTKQI